MRCLRWTSLGTLGLLVLTALLTAGAADQLHQHGKGETPKQPEKGRAPEELPRVPPPDVRAAQVPSGYHIEVVLANLTYPTSVEFDDAGTMYIAEGGYIYGDDVAPARILRVPLKGKVETVAEHLNGPVTDLLWHDKRLFISHRGKISVLEAGNVRDLVTGLPSLGDHHNNQLAVGPDGKLYFGQGTATNSGVVGLDNFKMGWLAKYPEVHDVPAKDIRLHRQAFETPDPLTLLADRRSGHVAKGKGHEGHNHDAKAKDQQRAKGHEGHEHHTKAKGHEGHGDKKEPAKAKGHEGHEGHDKVKEPAKGKGHQGHEQKGKDHHAGHGEQKSGEKSEGHEGHRMVKTFAFQPFGKTPPDDGAVRGAIKASGTILRMNPDGSDLEVYAWGLRNPFGVMWGPDGKLYASDNGYDERGSRPIAHAPDFLWVIKRDAWYGFPDYAGGVPVTDVRFQPEHGPAPQFLMRDHPPVERALVTLPHHVGAAKIDFSPSAQFGHKGQLFMALAGDMNPITGEHEERSGFAVVRIDPETRKVETFFRAKDSALGPMGMEYVVTSGPRRPVDVRFSPKGDALYVVDIGAMAILSTATGPAPRPFPRTGVVWRITRADSAGR